MFENSGSPIWWTPGGLTREGNPAGNPPGEIKATEAESIFQDLKRKELLLPAINNRGQACYILNECKEAEWKMEILDAGRPSWLKKRTAITVGKVMIWLLTAFLAGYLGAAGKNVADRHMSASPEIRK
jgi:hypothetical protein